MQNEDSEEDDSSQRRKYTRNPREKVHNHCKKKNENDESSSSRDEQQQGTPRTEKNPPVVTEHEAEHKISKEIGRPSAKTFIHENMVFPMREDFEIDSYELRFSLIPKKKISPKSSLNEEARFKSFFVSHIPYWFKCCNEIRGDMVWKSKARYFSKCSQMFNSCMNLN